MEPVAEVSGDSEDGTLRMVDGALIDDGFASRETVEQNFEAENVHLTWICEVGVCDSTVDDETLNEVCEPFVFRAVCSERTVRISTFIRFVDGEHVGVESGGTLGEVFL
jgi:hypothetical protein